MKTLSKIYKKEVEKNLKDIKIILKEIGVKDSIIASSYEDILYVSCKNLTKKWSSERKYIRTLFIEKAFSNFYPKKYLKISLYIDAIVNILDDLLDEKMDKKEKTFYIIEFLRIFSLYNYEKPNNNIQIAMGRYFNKLITLAIAENHFINLLKKEKKERKIIEYSINYFNLRCLDIDIFNEIIFTDYKASDNEKEKIRKIARIFRALNILKKDIKDIEYDLKNDIETIIIILQRKKQCDFNKYILYLLDYYLNEAKKIKFIKLKNQKILTPINNFYFMIEKEKKEIIKIINSL